VAAAVAEQAAAAGFPLLAAVLEQVEERRITAVMAARVEMRSPRFTGFRIQEAMGRIYWIIPEKLPLQRPRPAVWEEQALRVAPGAQAAPVAPRGTQPPGIPGAAAAAAVMAVLPVLRLRAWEVMAGPQQPPIMDFTPLIQALD
jgi:hypothetical protein